MMDGYGKKGDFENNDREEIYSKSVRAGKRTYFLDVKATKKNDYYLTITESKKKFDQDGKFHFEKHKIFLYKEDFDKFADGLEEAIAYIKKNQPYMNEETDEFVSESLPSSEYTNIEFEDLAK